MSDPITTFTGLLIALGKLLIGALPPALGALISLRFNTRDLTTFGRLIAFGSSFAVAWYIGEAMAEHFGLPSPVTDGAKLLVGLFGLNLIASIHEQLPTLITTAWRRLLGLGDNA